MNVKVKLFAVARDLVDKPEVFVTLGNGATVGELREALGLQIPSLSQWCQRVMIAVNQEYANDATVLGADDEVACIPPVSGG